MKTTKLQLSLLALFPGCVSLQAQYKWANPLNQDIHVVRGQAWQSELDENMISRLLNDIVLAF